MRRDVAEVAVRLHQRHAGGDRLEAFVADRAIGRQWGWRGGGFGGRRHRLIGGRHSAARAPSEPNASA